MADEQKSLSFLATVHEAQKRLALRWKFVWWTILLPIAVLVWSSSFSSKSKRIAGYSLAAIIGFTYLGIADGNSQPEKETTIATVTSLSSTTSILRETSSTILNSSLPHAAVTQTTEGISSTTVPPSTEAPIVTTIPVATTEAQQKSSSCDPNYSGACIPISSSDLDCPDISAKGFRVVGSDHHRFDIDKDGLACE